jgi:endoglucanase
LAALAAVALGLATVTATATPAFAAAGGGGSGDYAVGGGGSGDNAVTHTSSGTRFFVPPPDSGAVSQIIQLVKSRDFKDAALLTKMIATPQAVWFTSGTPAQVKQQVHKTLTEAALERAVPVLVAYDVPGRDCAQYSAGGALSQADYQAWIDGVSAAIGHTRVVVLLEPDALGNMPSDCHLPTTVYPFTDTERIAEVGYAVSSLGKDPNASVYLDATHSAWQSVGTMTQRLLQGGVQQARGFFVNVSNYQPTPELVDYGTWISNCIAMVTDPSSWAFGLPQDCASQYYPATQSDFSTWGLTTQWYADNMGSAVASTHFVIDTSRNGAGPNNMQTYAAAPYNQSASVVSKLASGNWCNPPASGLGARPTSNTGVPLLDAYLWVKISGQSDGQCNAAGGVRAWDYGAYTLPGWPTDAASQQLFDPLWGVNDPAAGAWFPQQALQLAQEAQPTLR